MDGTDGAKFATLQSAAEVEIESVFETLGIPTLHQRKRVCVVYEETVCLCGRVVGATL